MMNTVRQRRQNRGVPQDTANKIAEVTLAQCAADLAAEEDRTRTLDSKLLSLASLSGVATAINGAFVSNVARESSTLSLGFQIASASCVLASAAFFLFAMASALSGSFPREFMQVDEESLRERVDEIPVGALPHDVMMTFAASRVEALIANRASNDTKARTCQAVYRLVFVGTLAIALGLAGTLVGATVR